MRSPSTWKIPIAFLITLLTVPSISHPAEPDPQTLIGKVVKVADGDTLTLQIGKDQVKIRLAQIDAPEIRQPYGPRAKSELSRLALGKQAHVEVIDIDKYGRTVGEVHINGTHINQEMVRLGHAWAYTQYSRSLKIIDLENNARHKLQGLWQLPEPERAAPWNWRHSQKQKPTHPTDDRCTAKWTCGEMANCAEARFYFSQCGRSMLDGDGDGVPCESLCKP